MSNILKVQNGKIVDGKGTLVFLRGVNLGGWLMMEAYFMHSPNHPEHRFKNNFKKHFGDSGLREFELAFRKNFICEKDFIQIKQMGCNCVRIPFNYRLIEETPYCYDLDGVAYLDRAIKWARKYDIYVILDLHAAPGAQNHDWHSDSCGKCELFSKKEYQKRTFALWEFLADRYKDNETVAGYDLLNESVIGDAKKLNAFYKELIKTIRKVDKNHVLFIEGNNWAMDIDCLDCFEDNNYALSVHHYLPLDYTFNFQPQLKYPSHEWRREDTRKHLLKFKKIADQRKLPIFVGEFGINTREGFYSEDTWLEDVLSAFNDLGFHWTYWTYKAVKNAMFPDGLWSYYPNSPWVNRQGPLTGWETYHLHWKDKKGSMVASWKTKEFTENKIVTKVLKKYAHF